MIKTLEDIIKAYGNRLNTYAEDELKGIEEYLRENSIEIYEIKDDDNNIDDHSINIADVKTYLRYLTNHSIKEVFRYVEMLEKESFLLHFVDRIQKVTRNAVENDNRPIEDAYNLYKSYLDTVIREGICARITYCIGTYPMVTFSSYSDINKIIDVENEIIEEVTHSTQNLDEIATRVSASEEEIDDVFKFLINDSKFSKCTNATLRKDYKRRELIFEDGRFANLYWVVSNYYRLIMIRDQDISKKARDIWGKYEVIYDQAWKEIRNSR